MRILTVLTYYRPHISGLTIYAELIAKALAARGHEVTVLTSHYRKDLPREEKMDGVKIVRAPVAFRISKGVIMPTFGFIANRLTLESDAILLHLPQFDAAGVALRGRLLRKPTVVTYHCDLMMPFGLLSWAANQGIHLMNNLAATFTHCIVTYTQDYAENSPFASRRLEKLKIILPPVDMPDASQQNIKEFAELNNPTCRWPVIGMAARFATEKGVEVLINALPEILKVYPKAMVQFAGPYQNIVGEEAYFNRLYPLIRKYEEDGSWRFVGELSPAQMAAFYPNINLLVLPSLNSTEAFGLVQVEAMMHGIPVIASDLPGVRQPVRMHHMGRIIPIGDSQALADAAVDILSRPAAYEADARKIRKQYLPDTAAKHYELLFEEIRKKIKPS